MTLKEQAINKIAEIDSINADIQKLHDKEKQIRLDIKAIKEAIVSQNKHLIGKKGIVSDRANGILFTATCNAIMCTDDFNIKPLFAGKDKTHKYVEFIEWE